MLHMICTQCGRSLPDDSLFCQYCGAHFEDLTEDADIEIEAESPAEVSEPEPAAAAEAKTATEEKPAAAGNVRYCQKCGGVVDPKTKKCTNCGKQYFKFPTKRVLRGLVAALIIAMSCGLGYLYTQNQALAQELEIKTTDASKFENLYYYSEKRADKWKKQYLSLQDKYESIYDEYKFYHNRAVIVGEGVTNYHSFGCRKLFDDVFGSKSIRTSYWIYNTEAAVGRDYDPCPECQ